MGVPPIPKDLSFVEWQVQLGQGLWDGVQQLLPQAIISYSWVMPWDLMVNFLEEKIGDDGIVWIDLLAVNQTWIEQGNMHEIHQLPNVIEFVGQT